MSALPHTRLSQAVDGFLQRLGRAAAWLWLALLAIIVLNVTLRYAFGQGRVELEELQWHLYALGFLLALSVGLTLDDHVRVDVLQARLPLRQRCWIELYGILGLLLPFLLLVLFYSGPFLAESWRTGEISQAPGGLPLRWLIKGALPLGFALLLLAALGRLSRCCALLFAWPRGLPDSGAEGDS